MQIVKPGTLVVQKAAYNSGKRDKIKYGHWVGLITEVVNDSCMIEWVDIEAPPDYLPLSGISTANLYKEYKKFDLFPSE